MDRRRFRNNRQSQILARTRWFGWVMLMMCVLVQVAGGSEPSSGQSEKSYSQVAGG